MDLRTLLRLSRCSHAYHTLFVTALMGDLHHVVDAFVPHPSEFLHALELSRGFVGGEAAASFLLRLTTPLPPVLEVYLPHSTFLPFLHHLLFIQRAMRIPWLMSRNAPPFWLPLHGIQHVVTMRTTHGDIHVYRSASNDALLPISRVGLTPYMSFMNPRYFGTPFPSLLFKRRALLGEGAGDNTYDTEHLLSLGFDVRLTARAWPEYNVPPCPAHHFVCTAQSRTFTDAATLACRIDPLHGRRLNSLVVWRLDVRPCGGTCLMDGAGLLQHWQLFDYL